MKYSYLFLILSILWTFYLFNFNTGTSDITKSIKPNIQKRNIYAGETDHNKAFMAAAITTFFQKKYSSSKKEPLIDNEPVRLLTNTYKQPTQMMGSPDIGYENEYGEGVAIAITPEQEKVGEENEFGEGIAISSHSFGQNNGYDNTYGEGVAANIDPILEELIANTQGTAPRPDNNLEPNYD